jgi:hypothetical protein
MGGQVMATAADDLSDTANVTFYVVGSPIPTATEVALLDSIYPGSTSKLLSGIAFVESSLHQFTQLTNFGVDDYWPTESNDGGSLLGRAAGQASLGSAAGPMISGTWAIGSIRTADVKPAQVKALLGPDAAEVGAMVCDYAFADIACDGFYRLLVSDWTAASDSSSVLSETVRSSGD